MKNKHLSLNDRILIEEALNEGKSFKQIAKLIDKNCSSIPKEIKKILLLFILLVGIIQKIFVSISNFVCILIYATITVLISVIFVANVILFVKILNLILVKN